MATHVRKWGNSLGVRIPRLIAEQAGIGEGDEVEFLVREGAIVVRPCGPPPLRLDDLIARISRRNLHQPVETGRPVGREAW